MLGLIQIPDGTSIAGSVAGLTAIMIWRVREGRTAVSVKKLVSNYEAALKAQQAMNVR